MGIYALKGETMRLLAIAILLSGCASTQPGENVGPYTMTEYTVPACSQVTVSPHPGKAHWVECQVR